MLAQAMADMPTHELSTHGEADEGAPGFLTLVTLAGNAFRMPIDVAQYECFAELEDDVVNFLLEALTLMSSGAKWISSGRTPNNPFEILFKPLCGSIADSKW